MAHVLRPEQHQNDEISYSSTLNSRAPSTIVAMEKTPSPKKGNSVARDYDGANISLMEEDATTPSRTNHRPVSELFQAWIWEILSCIVAIAALVAFAVILRVYNGSSLSEWPHVITINSIISILVTLIKAMVVVPLAEGLSQLKWSWFEERERSLEDLVTFDEASRGIWGASKLVLFIKPWHLASIGSAVFLASFAIGPFSQEVVQVRSRDVNNTQVASVPVCGGNNFTYDDYIHTSLADEKPKTPTIGAIYEGIFKSSTNESFVNVICPSGNCTFPAYQSLGVCSRCEDVTAELSITKAGKKETIENCEKEGHCEYQLPNNHSLSFIELYNSDVSSLDVSNAKPFPIIHDALAQRNGFLHFTSIQGGGEGSGKVAATECIFYYCVKEYEGKTSLGEFTETAKEITSTTTGENPGLFFFGGWPVQVSPEYCVRNGTRKDPPYEDGDGCAYTFNGKMGNALLNVISKLVTGFVRRRGLTHQFSSDIIQSMYNEEDPTAVYNVFGNMSKVLTDHMRSRDDVCGGSSPGVVSITEPYFFVVWWWMIYPIVIVAATTLLLVLIMIKTRHHHIWKSSPLALVFSGLYQGPRMQTAHILKNRSGPEVGTMEEASRGMKAKLRNSGAWDVRDTGVERHDVGSVMDNVWLWRVVGKWIK